MFLTDNLLKFDCLFLFIFDSNRNASRINLVVFYFRPGYANIIKSVLSQHLKVFIRGYTCINHYNRTPGSRGSGADVFYYTFQCPAILHVAFKNTRVFDKTLRIDNQCQNHYSAIVPFFLRPTETGYFAVLLTPLEIGISEIIYVYFILNIKQLICFDGQKTFDIFLFGKQFQRTFVELVFRHFF